MNEQQSKLYFSFYNDLWKYFLKYSAEITDMNAATAIKDGVMLLNAHPNIVRAEHLLVAVQTQLEHIGKGEF